MGRIAQVQILADREGFSNFGARDGSVFNYPTSKAVALNRGKFGLSK